MSWWKCRAPAAIPTGVGNIFHHGTSTPQAVRRHSLRALEYLLQREAWHRVGLFPGVLPGAPILGVQVTVGRMHGLGVQLPGCKASKWGEEIKQEEKH